MRARVLTLLLALLLAGCATDEGGDPSDVTPSAPVPSTVAPTSDAPPGPPASNLTLSFARATLNATPGHAVTFPVTLTHEDEAGAVVVHLEGAGVQGSVPALFSPGSPATYFLTVDVAADAAPGERRLAAVVVDAAGRELLRREGAATVVVRAAGDGYEPGDVGRVVYAGRLAETGATFNTNDPALQGLAFAKTTDYSFSQGGTLPVTSLPRPSVVPGFHEAVLGMAPGESRTVTFPPEKGYGNATEERRFPREDVLLRRETLDLPEATLYPQDFAAYLNDTGQGSPEDYEVGERVVHERNGETLYYRIVEKTAEVVRLRLHAEVGDRFTLYPSWPNASVVEAANDTTATLYTTPTTPEGEAFTHHSHWPQLSRVERVNGTAIVVRHDPPVDFRFTMPSSSPFAPPQSYTVVSVDDVEIVASTPATHRLAGHALTFDILLAELVKGGDDG